MDSSTEKLFEKKLLPQYIENWL